MQRGFQRNLCRVRSLALLGGTALISTIASPAALAQVGTTAALPEDEIIVTALRRDTNLQDTPIAISVSTGAVLERSGSTSFTDLTRTAPSLRIVDSGPGQRRVLIRGIQSSGEPTVGVYYDEVPVSGSVSTSSDAAGTTPDFRLFDVERAEVLRGPQGTLFGRNASAGLVNIVSKGGTDTFEAEAQIDIEAVAQQIREIEQNMGAIDAKIADYCQQLGITSPFSVA